MYPISSTTAAPHRSHAPRARPRPRSYANATLASAKHVISIPNNQIHEWASSYLAPKLTSRSTFGAIENAAVNARHRTPVISRLGRMSARVSRPVAERDETFGTRTYATAL